MTFRPIMTGSTAERVIACPASAALPHVLTNGEAAIKGTAVHRFLASVRTLGREAALERVEPEWLAVCESIEVDAIPMLDPQAFAAEVALAYDLESGTARVLGHDIGRAYNLIHGDEIPLTVDTLGIAPDRVFVADYKTGRGRVTTAGRNAQLLLGALAACRAYGRSEAEVAIVYVREDEPPIFGRAFVDEWTLDEFAHLLRNVADQVREQRHIVEQGGVVTVRPGPQCRYCPAFVHCPAQTSLALTLAASPDSMREQALTPALARTAYERYRRAQEILKRAGEALHAYAIETGGIDLGDGVVYGPITTRKEYVDGAITRQVLTELHGPAIAELACSWDSSKTAIKEALKRAAAETGAKVAPLERETLAEIGKRGGIDRRETVTCKEHVPKRKALP
jgi:hypothetical protein